MSIFDQDLTLPGSITEIITTSSYDYDKSKFGTTDSIAIVGTAFNGPVGRPVEIYSPEHARYIFGEAYDYKTRKEATLVAAIQDAWDRGARTIYAVRVSGKQISKDFQFATDNGLKLRVSGLFPSNSNKDVYMVYDDTDGALAIKFYKPSKRATLAEKMQGLVENEDAILVGKLDLSGNYGYTKATLLTEVIRTFNTYASNNVLRLSIVNSDGVDVTMSSEVAKSMSLGELFGGAYFIGRSATNGKNVTKLAYVVSSDVDKLFDGFEGKTFKRIDVNSDVSKDLPIAGEKTELNAAFNQVVTMVNMFDFLAVPGKVDAIFAKDSIDYEEVSLKGFDLYSKLGSGFAVTAKISNDKVVESPVSDPNRIQAISDGIYSMLENLRTNYRTIACVSADEKIVSKLPSKKAFEKLVAKEMAALKKGADTMIIAKAKLDGSETAAKSYKFSFSKTNPTATLSTIYTGTVFESVSVTAETNPAGASVAGVKDGTLFAKSTELFETKNGKLVALTGNKYDGLYVVANGKAYVVANNALDDTLDAAAVNDKANILVNCNGIVTIYSYNPTGDAVEPICSFEDIAASNEDNLFVCAESVFGKDNIVKVAGSSLETSTLEEVVDALNSHAELSKKFTFSLADDGVDLKDSIFYDADGVITADVVGTAAADREISVDTNAYIPYKTTDNFARQLAQHCTYTSLKTYPTHGIIGCTTLMDTMIPSVAKKVEELALLDLDLYAKRPNGNNMLDKDNLPYNIGKSVSVVVGQYTVNVGSNYAVISNGAAGYAGMISTLPIDQSSTNQAIALADMGYTLTNYQLDKLTKKGFVTFKQSYSKGIVVTDGITMAPADSIMRRLSAARIGYAVEDIIKTATEPFIGKQNSMVNRNSMQTAIKSGLNKVVGKLVEAYDFNIIVDPAAYKLGIVNIDYTVVPIYEIKEIRNRITFKDSLQ